MIFPLFIIIHTTIEFNHLIFQLIFLIYMKLVVIQLLVHILFNVIIIVFNLILPINFFQKRHLIVVITFLTMFVLELLLLFLIIFRSSIKFPFVHF